MGPHWSVADWLLPALETSRLGCLTLHTVQRSHHSLLRLGEEFPGDCWGQSAHSTRCTGSRAAVVRSLKPQTFTVSPSWRPEVYGQGVGRVGSF